MATKKIYKIAITAGHYLGTEGKRCLKALDPNETKEWVLNDRIVRKIIELLKAYEGYEILRTDDPTGKKDISLTNRCKAANEFGADDYFSVHHNASGVKNFTGGGIMVYVYTKVDDSTKELQQMLYEALIEETGLKGNRATPKAPYFVRTMSDKMYLKARRTGNFYVEDTCIGCGLCAKQCPVQAIKIQNGKPVRIKEHCTLCLRCLHLCPKFSIQYGDGKTKQHGQYHHP